MSTADSAVDVIRDEMREFVKTIAIYLPPGRELGDDDDLMAIGAIDSLGFVELVEEVQSRYGVTVADVEIVEENFGSIAAIARFVDAKRSP